MTYWLEISRTINDSMPIFPASCRPDLCEVMGFPLLSWWHSGWSLGGLPAIALMTLKLGMATVALGFVVDQDSTWIMIHGPTDYWSFDSDSLQFVMNIRDKYSRRLTLLIRAMFLSSIIVITEDWSITESPSQIMVIPSWSLIVNHWG